MSIANDCHSGIPNGTFPELLSVNGGEGATAELYDAGAESNLDFQMAYGLIWPQEPALFQVDDEWYQQSQLQSAEYAGFFNSKSLSKSTPSTISTIIRALKRADTQRIRPLERYRWQLLHVRSIRRERQLQASGVPRPRIPEQARRGLQG